MTAPDAAAAPSLLVVVGPTASGKTELAVALAERYGGEIVSADSVQVYRAFSIGTGKPSHAERARAVHHLIDVVEPLEAVDAARFAELAEAAIADIRARGKLPIVCGGTFVWVRALVYGLAAAPPADPVVRARHRALVDAEGRPALHAALARVDPAAAARLAPNDFVRVSRALEVYELTGAPLTAFHEGHGFKTARYQARLLGVRRAPSELDERIATRVRAMLDAGWVDEVRALIAAGYESARAMGSVGYKQIHEALRSAAPVDDEALFDPIRRATRVFARRQRTWLRDENVEWLEPGVLPAVDDG
jgi:tRNA dimethylallyltransferase